jgi:hypothetical protein
MLSATTRLVLGAVGVLVALAGLVASSAGAGLSGLWVTVMGAALVIAVVIERQRYRSEEADRASEPSGPGGGEPPGSVEPRFRPTDELFVDPTTGVQMRVHIDPRTGERRYVAVS